MYYAFSLYETNKILVKENDQTDFANEGFWFLNERNIVYYVNLYYGYVRESSNFNFYKINRVIKDSHLTLDSIYSKHPTKWKSYG